MTRTAFIDCCPFLAAIVASVLAARGLLWFSGARWQWCRLRLLLREERGAIQSLSFVLTLPLFVLLMLFIVQLSQLTIARIFVEYSAFAAARSAQVWFPADLGDTIESPNRIGVRLDGDTVTDEENNTYRRHAIQGPSRKLQRVELAVAQALMPAAPSRDFALSRSHPAMAALPTMEKVYPLLDPQAPNNTQIAARLRNKLAYTLAGTQVEVEVRHKIVDYLGRDLPELTRLNGFEDNEIGWEDQILVTVRHDFALLPGPARFLARRALAPGQTADDVSARIQSRSGVYVYPLTATVRLSNEGETSALAFVQN